MSGPGRDPANAPLLAVEDLAIAFPAARGQTRPVDGVSFAVAPGERLGLVGESGSGKSLTALAVMRLLPAAGRVVRGRVDFAGQDVLALGPRAATRYRGREVAMVYQNPLSSLNPIRTIGGQLSEAIRVHGDVGRPQARRRAAELLGEVGIAHGPRRLGSYPHEYSGGMLQRVVLALALAGEPRLLIADEATSALDVTTQARVIELLMAAAADRGMALVFITHDLGAAAALCESVQVMYAGRIVERTSAEGFYDHPVHPYSEALLASTCRFDEPVDRRLPAIAGQPPLAGDPPPGCAFHPRCPAVVDRCRTVRPEGEWFAGPRYVECHRAAERGAGEGPGAGDGG
jgi:peptide/nickel transport system ATP-binding protein